MCEHLHDTTSRYDAAERVLTFLLVCRSCRTEQVVEAVEYEPRPEWTARGAAGRLAVVPVDVSTPPAPTRVQWRCRSLAA